MIKLTFNPYGILIIMKGPPSRSSTLTHTHNHTHIHTHTRTHTHTNMHTHTHTHKRTHPYTYLLSDCISEDGQHLLIPDGNWKYVT